MDKYIRQSKMNKNCHKKNNVLSGGISLNALKKDNEKEIAINNLLLDEKEILKNKKKNFMPIKYVPVIIKNKTGF